MKFLQALFLFLATSLFIQAQNAETIPATDMAKALLEDLSLPGKSQAFIGVAAAVSRHGEMRWQGVSGLKDTKKGIPAAFDMHMRPASIAKPMTAVAIMQLVEQGLIDLDKPVQHYLPDYPQKNEVPMTIRHLLNHTAGIPGYASSKESESKTEYPNLNEAINIFKDRDLTHTPGEAFLYSTYGYVLLGRIIEEVSGLAYEQYMKQNIFEKAGMSNTYPENFGQLRPEQATLYHCHKKGKIKPGEPNNLSNRTPGGGFVSTVDDLMAFGQAVLSNQLITKESFAQMMMDPGIRKPEEGNAYGFGWFIYGKSPMIIGHTGEQTGSSAQILIFPEFETIVVVLSNTSGSLKEAFNLSVELFKVLIEPEILAERKE